MLTLQETAKFRNRHPPETDACNLILFIKREVSLIRRVDIQFRGDFKRRVHRQQRDSAVEHLYIQICYILRNCPAAAGVHLAQLRALPEDLVVMKQLPHGKHKLCIRI